MITMALIFSKSSIWLQKRRRESSPKTSQNGSLFVTIADVNESFTPQGKEPLAVSSLERRGENAANKTFWNEETFLEYIYFFPPRRGHTNQPTLIVYVSSCHTISNRSTAAVFLVQPVLRQFQSSECNQSSWIILIEGRTSWTSTRLCSQ